MFFKTIIFCKINNILLTVVFKPAYINSLNLLWINVKSKKKTLSFRAPSNSGREGATVAVATNFYNDVYYNMNFPKRGLALIFNHEQFELPGIENRPESRIDRDALVLRLSALEFEVEVLDDKRVQEIEDKISEGKMY